MTPSRSVLAALTALCAQLLLSPALARTSDVVTAFQSTPAQSTVLPPAQKRRAVTGDLPRSAGPAQAIFDEVSRLLLNSYGGLSTVDRTALVRDYQLRLNTACAPTPTTCAATVAYPLLSAEVEALGDEHTYFEDPKEHQDFVTEASGGSRRQFGVRLARLDNENRVVLEVTPGSAAASAGLRRGDVLLTINGQPYTYELLRQAREGGQPTILTLRRLQDTLNVTITATETSTRQLPTLTTVPAAQGPVGLLRIPTFLTGGGVAQAVHDLVAQAQQQGLRGLVVDLRSNPGGSLSECDGAVSAFVPSFTRVSRSAAGDTSAVVEGGRKNEAGRNTALLGQPALWTGPVSVLVDKASASCSEFFAYELQYARRAVVVGEATSGVGNTATRVFELGPDDELAGLHLTVITYTKPGGQPYPVRVTPDLPGSDDIARLAQGVDVLLDLGVNALSSAPSLPAPTGQGSTGKVKASGSEGVQRSK